MSVCACICVFCVHVWVCVHVLCFVYHCVYMYILCVQLCVCLSVSLTTNNSWGEIALIDVLTALVIILSHLQAHDAPIRSMRWSHAHDWLISSDDRGLVKYWQSNMNNVHTFQAHSDPVRCLRWGDDMRQHRCYRRHQCSIVIVYSVRRHSICLVDCCTCKCCFSFLINNHHLKFHSMGQHSIII